MSLHNLPSSSGGGGVTLDSDPCNLASLNGAGELMVTHGAEHYGSSTAREVSNQLWDVQNDATFDIPERSVTITNPSSCYGALARVRAFHGILWVRTTGLAIAPEFTMRYYPAFATALSATPPTSGIYPNYTLIHAPAKDQTLEPWTAATLGNTERTFNIPAGGSLSATVGGRLLQRLPTTGPAQISFYLWHETLTVDLFL